MAEMVLICIKRNGGKKIFKKSHVQHLVLLSHVQIYVLLIAVVSNTDREQENKRVGCKPII